MTYEITKFQDLKVDTTFTVTHFKPIVSKFGKSYILTVIANNEGREIDIFSTNSINIYFQKHEIEKQPEGTRSDFTVRRIKKGKFVRNKYAVIDGFNSGEKVDMR